MSTVRILDPLAFALRGSQLVEASAGTGKTFTISALFLRLVLGHGGPDAAFGRPLDPPEILVVTFTDAATKELRDRVRQRLAEAAVAFRADPAAVPRQPAGTDLLHDLRASYPPAQWPACAARLQLAAEWMDEAAISTIHGWCNRMLREHAFDSGSLFSQALQADARELFDEAVRDYWRSFVYPLSAAEAETVLGWWKTPADLGKAIDRLQAHRERLEPGAEPAAAMREARARADALLAEWKRPWTAWAGELLEAIEAALAQGRLKASSLTRRRQWCAALQDWAGGPQACPALTGTAWERLTPAGMDAIETSGQGFHHPALEDLASLRRRIEQLPDGRAEVQCHATAWVAARVAQEKARRAEMGFDDMLWQLDAALRRSADGRLAKSIRAQFPVALIDEFQDTDALQYRIFNAIWPVRADAGDNALVMIGDPKQAIYSFRGADIHTYLAAKADTEGRHSTLGTNFRSSRQMVEAVNHLFMRAEQRPGGGGAFLFGGAQGNPLPFVPVAARGRGETWTVQGEAAPALTCWWHGEDDDGALADACAAEVVRLLRLGQAGQAGFARAGEALQPVRPGDMAVLVNTGREAQAIRRALSRVGVRSVYLSDKDSVYETEVAGDVQRLLQACAAPEDERLLRAALATPLLGQDWERLERLNLDESAWEEAVLQFRQYREQWRRQGVLPLLRRLLNDFEVPHRLLARGDERTLTDVLHLAELLQQASALLDGEHALVRHLAEHRAEEGVGGNDSRIVRLESDADLLKVVTVHKSKGLEYPLVFLPFPCSFRAVKPTDTPIQWHEGDERRITLSPGPAQVAAADRERLAEDLRKLYVALTRARHATWIGLAPAAGLERSGLGCLLGGEQPLAPQAVEALLRGLPAECAAIAFAPAPAASADIYQPAGRALQWAPEPPLPATAPARWWIASYSRLRTEEGPVAEGMLADAVAPDPAEGTLPLPESAAEATFIESAEPDGDAAGTGLPTGAGEDLHAFPRGASPGSFLHGLLEWAGREGFAQAASQPADMRRVVAQRCRARGWGEWTDMLCRWLGDWLQAPLRLPAPGPGPGGALRPIDLRSWQVEMEFWFATGRVDAREIDRLVCAHTLGGAPRRALQAQELHGMFKGFIDLVFEHEGRWWVADYKSNALGRRDADYTAEAVREAVLQHRYELQYTLYVFALHRHLRARLADYDYDRHVGGAVYLFLRGHAAASQGLHVERPPRALMDGLDALFSGAGEGA